MTDPLSPAAGLMPRLALVGGLLAAVWLVALWAMS